MEQVVRSSVPLGFRIAFCTPLVLSLVCCASLQPELVSIAAPLLGPWAGHLYGHAECSLAAVLPAWSFVLLGSGVLGLVALARLAPGRLRAALAVALVAWSLAWSAFATLSVANTTI